MADNNSKIIKVTINGKSTSLKVKKDLSWGDTVELFRTLSGSDDQGMMGMVALLHKLLELIVLDTTVFDPHDTTAIMKLSATEVTKLLGEVLKQFPLEQYMANLGITMTEEGELVTPLSPKISKK